MRFKRDREDDKKSKDQVVEEDDRFKVILEDKKFSVAAGKVDKRGRKVNKQVGDEYKKFYQMREEPSKKEERDVEEEVDDEEEEVDEVAAAARFARFGKEDSDSSSSDEEEFMDEEDDEILAQLVAYRAGQGNLEGLPDDAAATHRLACMSLDWDVLGSVDLYMILKSFVPPNGMMKSVTVYPSRFGLQRLEQEETGGPVIDQIEDDATLNMMSQQEKKIYLENRIRCYELERRQYYFAVIDCDSAETATALYNACDGVEINNTASVFDLRYIPDDQKFDDLPVRDYTDQAPVHYIPPQDDRVDGVSSTRAEIKWDTTSAKRLRVTMKPLEQVDLEEADFADLIASNSSDGDESDSGELRIEGDANDDDNAEKKAKKERARERIRSKYAVLLEGIQDAVKEEDEMIVTFKSGLEEVAVDALKKKAELEMAAKMTPFEKQQAERARRKKEKKEAKKAARREKEDSEDDGEGKRKKKKHRKEKDEEEEEEVEEISPEERKRRQDELQLLVAGEKKTRDDNDEDNEALVQEIDKDDRFSKLFTRPEFAIDRTDQRFKKTKSMEKLMEKIRDKRQNTHVTNASSDNAQAGNDSASLKSLAERVKQKAKASKK